MRALLSADRTPVPAGAFTLYLHPTEDHPFLNYAIPDEGAEPDDGAALVAAARERGLVPRIEAVAALAPWVRELPGFTVELEPPLMTCEQPAEMASDASLVVVEAGSDLAAPVLGALMEAFGEPPPSRERVEGFRGRTVAAVVGGEVVGGASWTRPIDGISEVAGIGVRESFRRRGIAGALTAEATRHALTEGATLVFLSPGHDGAKRVYERAGYADASRMIHARAQA